MDLDKIKPNKEKAIFLAKREISVLIYDAVNLEGINYTIPEIQTILDGITVGGAYIIRPTSSDQSEKCLGQII